MYDSIIFTDTNQTHGVFKSIGAYKCAYILRRAGYTCLVIDLATHFNKEEMSTILQKCISNRTLFVGFSSTFLYRKLTGSVELLNLGAENEIQLVQQIKYLNKNCKIVLGGAQATEYISLKYVDYSVIGYAEFSILSLANHLRQGTPLENSHRNISGVVIIDDRFGKGYDFASSNFSWTEFDISSCKVLPIEISRGCIFRCKFCSYPMNGKNQLDFMRSEEALYTELQSNYDMFGIQEYSFIDDTFNDNDFKLDMMLRVVGRLTFKPRFWAYLRLDLISSRPGSIDKLYDIGLRSTYFGIETLNKKTGLIIGKGYDRSKQIETLNQIRNKFGNEIITHGSFIVGLPGESVESIKSSHAALLSGDIPLHSYIFSGLGIYKSSTAANMSDISKNYPAFGYEEIPNSPNTGLVNWKNEHMTSQEANVLATHFNKTGYDSGKFYLSGQAATGLRNIGYSSEELHNTKFNEFDWSEADLRKDNFIAAYKEKLNKHIDLDLYSQVCYNTVS